MKKLISSFCTEHSDIIKEFGSDIFKEIKILNLIYKGYCIYRKYRISHFLHTLDLLSGDIQPRDKEKFTKYIQSDHGLHLLGEYMDSVLNTSSEIVHSTMAIFYSDYDNKKYTLEFKSTACLAIRNIPNFSIDAFISIMDNAKKTDEDESEKDNPWNKNPYPVYIIENSNNILDPIMLSVVINDLINRGIILKDPANNRFGASVGIFGKSKFSKQVYDLLVKAKKLSSKTLITSSRTDSL